MLAYMMLISPACVQSLAEGANLYSDLDSRHWAQGDTTIEYGYDDNGSKQCQKPSKCTHLICYIYTNDEPLL